MRIIFSVDSDRINENFPDIEDLEQLFKNFLSTENVIVRNITKIPKLRKD